MLFWKQLDLTYLNSLRALSIFSTRNLDLRGQRALLKNLIANAIVDYYIVEIAMRVLLGTGGIALALVAYGFVYPFLLTFPKNSMILERI